MGLFDYVPFCPQDVKAVAEGKGTRAQLIAIVTSQTCGEACWHAREEVCRCSCGGKNHGCLNHGGERPERHSKIDGIPYKLAGVGPHESLTTDADRINREAGYRYVDKPSLVIDGFSSQWTEDDIAQAKARGAKMWWTQYYYTWRETDSGAPARIKTPSESQKKWTELAGFAGQSDTALLWVRLEMPARPTQLRVDENGVPMANQNPE